MNAQADVDAAVVVLLELTQGLTNVLTELQADLAGKGVDTTKLDDALPPLQAAEQALQQLADSSAPPTTSTTGTTTTPGTSTTGTTTTTGTGTTTAP
jgi:hypothetical protein